MLNPCHVAQVAFVLGAEIGVEGKNSKVFVAHDPQLDAELVVKKIAKARLADPDNYFSESRLLYKSAHSNVLPVHYACFDDDHIYVVMPRMSNGSLKGILAARMLTVREVVVFATQFLSGLHHVHSKKLIHFDVKPDNILISDRGEALLSDFGLAKQMEFGGHAGQDRMYGKMTPPEWFTDQYALTTRADIYQAGLTLFRMCAGDAEFYRQFSSFLEHGVVNRDEFRHAVLNAQFPDTDALPQHIPNRLKTTITKCLKTDPRRRFSSVIEIVNELAAIEGEILDWAYQITADGREWSKDDGDAVFRLLVGADGSSLATRAGAGGAVRRINAYCLESITATQIRRFLTEH